MKDVRDFPAPPERDPFLVRLEDTDTDTWGNTILWKLGVALGDVERGSGSAVVNPDDILEKALEIINQWSNEYGYL
jgi:hypothetical protein